MTDSLSRPLSNVYLQSSSMGEVLGMRGVLLLSASLGEGLGHGVQSSSMGEVLGMRGCSYCASLGEGLGHGVQSSSMVEVLGMRGCSYCQHHWVRGWIMYLCIHMIVYELSWDMDF